MNNDRSQLRKKAIAEAEAMLTESFEQANDTYSNSYINTFRRGYASVQSSPGSNAKKSVVSSKVSPPRMAPTPQEHSSIQRSY